MGKSLVSCFFGDTVYIYIYIYHCIIVHFIQQFSPPKAASVFSRMSFPLSYTPRCHARADPFRFTLSIHLFAWTIPGGDYVKT